MLLLSCMSADMAKQLQLHQGTFSDNDCGVTLIIMLFCLHQLTDNILSGRLVREQSKMQSRY